MLNFFKKKYSGQYRNVTQPAPIIKLFTKRLIWAPYQIKQFTFRNKVHALEQEKRVLFVCIELLDGGRYDYLSKGTKYANAWQGTSQLEDQSYLCDVRRGFSLSATPSQFPSAPPPYLPFRATQTKKIQQQIDSGYQKRVHITEEKIHFIYFIYLLFPRQWR